MNKLFKIYPKEIGKDNMKDKFEVMIIEDDKDIAGLLKYNLEKVGSEALLAYDGEEGLSLIKENMPDLIILDLMLPKVDG